MGGLDRGAGLLRRLVNSVRNLSPLEVRVSLVGEITCKQKVGKYIIHTYLLLSRETSFDVDNLRARLAKFLEGSLCLFSSTLKRILN